MISGNLKNFCDGVFLCLFKSVPYVANTRHSINNSFDPELAFNHWQIPRGSDNKESVARQETWIWSLGQEDPLEKGMATHSSILPWRIPCTEEQGRLQSMEWQRVGHDWATNTFIFRITYRGLVRSVRSYTRVSDLVGGTWSLRIYIPNQFPGGTDVATENYRTLTRLFMMTQNS